MSLPLRLVTVVGARPQLIKTMAVSRRLARSEHLDEVLLHTGQHYDASMSDVFFDELGLVAPVENLGIKATTHGAQTGRMLEAIEGFLARRRPGMVLLYGDTNSTLAGALAAAKLRIPIAHIEAGVRSFDMAMPEEVNRVLTDRLSRLLFAPSASAARNLAREGLPPEAIKLVGDPLFDAFLLASEQAGASRGVLDRLGLVPREFVLATVHRQENTDDTERLAAIFEGLASLAGSVPVIVPLHPRTRKALRGAGRLEAAQTALRLLEPLPYFDMMALERTARFIVTDSGGVQREAFYAGVPSVVLRSESEWPELVSSGWSQLVEPTSGEGVALALQRELGSVARERPTPYPLGRGDSAAKIVDELECFTRTR